MNTKKYCKKTLVLAGIFLIFLLMQIGTSLINAAEPTYYATDDYARYTQSGTKAYIPYGGGRIFIQIKDFSNPNDIKVDVIDGHDDDIKSDKNVPLLSSTSANELIINNISINTDLNTRPGQFTADSEIGKRWNEGNLTEIEEYYNEVPRQGIELNFSYLDDDLFGDHYNISCYYLWDKETGILLKKQFYFNNTDQQQYSGEYSLYLVETSVWTLDTGAGIPGFHLEILIPAVLVGILFAYFKKRKEWRVL